MHGVLIDSRPCLSLEQARPRQILWRLALFVFAIGFTLPLHALDPRSTITAYNAQSWYSDDGLPHNTVQGIAQTNDGYLWFATWAGVARFNGRTFKVFNSENTKEFVNSGVPCVRIRCDIRLSHLKLRSPSGGFLYMIE